MSRPPLGEVLTVGVVGATGYTGAETLRWCLGHPRLRVVGATSRQHAGRRIGDVWPQLAAFDVPITAEPPEADVLFLCLPHGEAAKLAPSLTAPVVIDLSGDHRLPEPEHGRTYGFPRGHDAWLYGLPELGMERLRGATRVANPGCFATALALALLPMRGSLPTHVSCVGLTGSTGSGVSPSAGTHHPERAENLRAYKVLAHQHVPEVRRALLGDTSDDVSRARSFQLDFVPMSAPLRRGILVTAFLPGATLAAYRSVYEGNPLVRVLDRAPELLHVAGSARADVGVVEGDGTTAVFCAIDNLCRGAGSQAVANLNLSQGWPYALGLQTPGPLP